MIKLTLDTTLQKLNISRYELAKRTGIQYQIIDNYYKNRVKRYDSDVLDRICTALGCGIEDIIEYSRQKPGADFLTPGCFFLLCWLFCKCSVCAVQEISVLCEWAVGFYNYDGLIGRTQLFAVCADNGSVLVRCCRTQSLLSHMPMRCPVHLLPRFRSNMKRRILFRVRVHRELMREHRLF